MNGMELFKGLDYTSNILTVWIFLYLGKMKLNLITFLDLSYPRHTTANLGL